MSFQNSSSGSNYSGSETLRLNNHNSQTPSNIEPPKLNNDNGNNGNLDNGNAVIVNNNEDDSINDEKDPVINSSSTVLELK